MGGPMSQLERIETVIAGGSATRAVWTADSLVEALRRRAVLTPERVVFSFASDGETVERRLTFGELHRKACAIAAALRGIAAAGERALLMYPPGLEFVEGFFGCLYAGLIAVPCSPPDSSRSGRTAARLHGILADAGPRVILVDQASLERRTAVDLGGPVWLATDRIEVGDEAAAPAVSPAPEDVAMLLYTSGSTGTPRGVVVSHGNLVSSLRMQVAAFGGQRDGAAFADDGDDVGVSWLPLDHDLGLVVAALHPVWSGGHGVLLSPVSFLQQPVRWLRAISTFRATYTYAPNFAYELCIRKVPADSRVDLDLGSLRIALNGAEPVRAATLSRFAEMFAPCGFRPTAMYPAYGMTEATSIIAGGADGAGPVVRRFSIESLEAGACVGAGDGPGTRRLVGCGRTMEGLTLRIVDPQTGAPCPAGRVGEVWLRGPNIAAGYWNRPAETEETFRARMADGDGPFFRTGDLGAIVDGELFLTGRLKDLIIIDGKNHWPQDIELTVEGAHPSLRPGCGAAFEIEVDDRAQVVVVHEIDLRDRSGDLPGDVPGEPRRLDATAILAAIGDVVAREHGVPLHAVVLVAPRTIAKTASGKIARRICRQGFLDESLDVVAAWRSPARTGAGPREMAGPANSPSEPREVAMPANSAPRREVRTAAGSGSGARAVGEIRAWLIGGLAAALDLEPDLIDPREPFARFGLKSSEAIFLTGQLEGWLGRPVSPILFWECPSVDALAVRLAGFDSPGREAGPDPEREAGSAALLRAAGSRSEPIAIVGVGCRFPGGIVDLESFWRVLDEELDATGEMPPDRWDVDALYDPDARAHGKMITRRGGFLDGIDQFEPGFFGISPREAAAMDPQHRLLLETSWEALEQAGIPVERLAGSDTGVFVGVMYQEYATLNGSEPERLDGYVATGSAASVASGRIAYLLGAEGPSLTVDTACSSSLVTLHLACQSLRAGECSTALAGGVTLMLTPTPFVEFSRLSGLAPDGRCKSFDGAADGVAWSEGCGMAVLKRLSDAERDGDPILAVIAGSAVNSDGRSNGLTAPNGRAQEQVIRQALRQAGLAPEAVDYVEAHGTGTLLGDPIELQALAAVFGTARSPAEPLLVGSVKSNLGHTQAAAGIAGVIKAILAMRRGVIPRSLHFTALNPHVRWDGLPLAVAGSRVHWPSRQRARNAGVSSFGVSGTNAHLVLAEPPRREAEPAAKMHGAEPGAEIRTAEPGPEMGTAEPRVRLLPLSARSPAALASLARAYRDFLGRPASATLDDIAYTASVRRSHHDWRLAVVGSSREEMIASLDAFTASRPTVEPARLGPGTELAFVFSGQGPQWWGMGRELLTREPAFRAALERCDAALRPHAGWSVLDELARDAERSRLHRTDVAQPVLFGLQVALVALWESWGVRPDAVVGHSFGEVAAAHVAGALSLADAARLVAIRGQLTERATGGRMAVVALSESEVLAAIEGAEPGVVVAAVNAPASVVLAGAPGPLGAVIERLESAGVSTRWLAVDHAFHSAQMDPARAGLVDALASLVPGPTSIPFISSMSGRLEPGESLDGGYWGQQLREPVRFAAAVESLIDRGAALFVEIAPHPVLGGSIAAVLAARRRAGTVLASLRREAPEQETALSALGALYARGYPVDWRRLHPSGRSVELPGTPWQRTRHWLAPAQPRPAHGGHPLLGVHRASATCAGEHTWELASTAGLTYLEHHRVQSRAVLPGSAYVEMALAAAAAVLGPGGHRLEDLALRALMDVGADEPRTVQLALALGAEATASFQVFSRPADGSADWTLHATGSLRGGTERQRRVLFLEDVRERCPDAVSAAAHYAAMEARGLDYGPSFRGVEQRWRGGREAIARIRLPDAVGDGPRHLVHPALLDACFQVLAAGISDGVDSVTYVPIGLAAAERHACLPAAVWAHVAWQPGPEGAVDGDIALVDDGGRVLFEVRGLRAQPIAGARRPAVDNWFHEVEWQEQARPRAASGHGAGRLGPGSAEPWLVVGSAEPLADAITAELAARGAVVSRTDGAAAASALAQGARGVVYVARQAAPSEEPPELAAESCAELLELVQALVAARATSSAGPGQPRLWLITRDAQAASPGEDVSAPALTALWGLARVVAQENAELRCSAIDIGAATPAATVVDELLADGDEDQIALRGLARSVARVVRRARPGDDAGSGHPDERAGIHPSAAPMIGSDGLYLVTGGLGALGLAVARWLVDRGARRLLLIGRSGAASDAQRAAVDALSAAGAEVRVAAVDVADAAALADALAAASPLGPLRGVVHAAGVVDDATLVHQTRARFDAVLAPKVAGAWNLHRLTRACELDFFVLFSSASEVLGVPGQASYAAGNAFLDGLARHRRAVHLPALCIAWGPWAEIGVAAERERRGERLAARGVSNMPPGQALEALGRLMAARATSAAVLAVDWRGLTGPGSPFRLAPLYRHWIDGGDSLPQGASVGARLKSVDREEHHAVLVAALTAHVAVALRMPAEGLDPDRSLTWLGVDSLMAVALRTWIERELGVPFASAELLGGASISELARLLAGRLRVEWNVERLRLEPGATANSEWESFTL
jgi:acyl transferase domain-containing protein/acyl-CoA synthetase (AMP-forming)/AMP-acid ligase II/acyl carrier protein